MKKELDYSELFKKMPNGIADITKLLKLKTNPMKNFGIPSSEVPNKEHEDEKDKLLFEQYNMNKIIEEEYKAMEDFTKEWEKAVNKEKTIKYKCKDNDNRIKLILLDGELDEIWVGTSLKSEGYTIISAEDLRKALKLVNKKLTLDFFIRRDEEINKK